MLKKLSLVLTDCPFDLSSVAGCLKGNASASFLNYYSLSRGKYLRVQLANMEIVRCLTLEKMTWRSARFPVDCIRISKSGTPPLTAS